MKHMKKDDLRSLILSVIINIIVILLIPGMKIPQREDGKISVGLVEFSDENAKISPEKQEEESVVEEPPTIAEEVVEEKPVEEPKQEAVEEQKPAPKPLPEIAPLPDIEVLVSPVAHTRKRPDATTQEVVRQERVLEEDKNSDMIEISGAELERKELAEIETTPITSERESSLAAPDTMPTGTDEGEGFVDLASETDKLEGLPKGYKDIGSSDGNLTGRWDEANRLPVYPESAELQGKTGTVELQVFVTEDGRVQKIEIKGSGVPELNRAIEEVARTWRIYLSKNGQRVYGDVTLEIPFRLLRGE